MTFYRRMLLPLLSIFLLVISSITWAADAPKMGIVLMHGKSSSPSKHVYGLAKKLKKNGYHVANIEMPWSGRRQYDVNVNTAVKEVEKAIADLKAAGAQKVFVGGHSQGGAFALYLAGKIQIDGIIAIAPGGNVASKKFRTKLGKSINRAYKMIENGKGDKRTNLKDYEGSKGVFSVRTTPNSYVTWFDPQGAMNTKLSANNVSSQVPILWLVAERDYAGLLRSNIPMFDRFPENPNTTLHRPNSDHKGAPVASYEEIVRWTTKVATGK